MWNTSFLTKLSYRFYHIIQFFIPHAGIKSDPEGIVHYFVGIGQGTRHTVINTFNKRFKTGVFQNVSGKEIAGLDLVVFKIFCQIIAGEVRFI